MFSFEKSLPAWYYDGVAALCRGTFRGNNGWKERHVKRLTFTVPCYNSAAYLDRCVRSLLPGGRAVEILLIDDGSTDATGAMADAYALAYPDIVRVIHQPNGGHGEGINQGIRHAKGKYIKIVDSDDWVDGPSLQAVLALLEKLEESGEALDLIVHDYVYEMTHRNAAVRVNLRPVCVPGRAFGWEDCRRFPITRYFMMHSLLYRTELLRECRLNLPKHTFYEDSLFIYQPLPYTKRVYYLDVPFYRYYVGREDQSINMNVILKRLDQHVRVAELLYASFHYKELRRLPRTLRLYMVGACRLFLSTTTALLYKSGTPESLAAKKKLWRGLRAFDPALYRHVRWGIMGAAVNLPGRPGRFIAVKGYEAIRRVMKF
jgi:glycosyltransferase involved in cell wall biosynthesis